MGVMVMLLLIMGCSSPETVSEDADQTIAGKNGAADPQANLDEKPNSYCVTYSTFLAAAKITQEMEYCQTGSDIMSFTEQTGFQIQSFCVEGKGSRCTGDARNQQCFEDNNLCTSLHDTLANVDLSRDAAFYEKMPERSIAGLPARCYRADIGRMNSRLGNTVDMPEALRYANLCYHPKFKMLLFYDFNGIKTEVKSFVTPAPVEKFRLPQ